MNESKHEPSDRSRDGHFFDCLPTSNSILTRRILRTGIRARVVVLIRRAEWGVVRGTARTGITIFLIAWLPIGIGLVSMCLVRSFFGRRRNIGRRSQPLNRLERFPQVCGLCQVCRLFHRECNRLALRTFYRFATCFVGNTKRCMTGLAL